MKPNDRTVHSIKTLIMKAVGDEFDRQMEFGYMPGVEDLQLVIADAFRGAAEAMKTSTESMKLADKHAAIEPRSSHAWLQAGLRRANPNMTDGQAAAVVQDITHHIAIDFPRLKATMEQVWEKTQSFEAVNAIFHEEAIMWQVVWSTCVVMSEDVRLNVCPRTAFISRGYFLAIEVSIALFLLDTVVEAATDLTMAVSNIFTPAPDKGLPSFKSTHIPIENMWQLDAAFKRISNMLCPS